MSFDNQEEDISSESVDEDFIQNEAKKKAQNG
jgi:hypothetical protein